MSLSEWRCAVRVARRDAGRAKGRTVLVVLLIAFPILVLSGVDIAFRTYQLDTPDKIVRNLGRADVAVKKFGDAVQQPVDGWLTEYPLATARTFPPPAATAADIRGRIPGVVHLVSRRVLDQQWVIRTTDGLQRADVEEFAYADPLVRGILRPVAGRAPSGPDEVSLTPQLANLLHVGIGSLLHRADNRSTWRVVGLVRDPQARTAADIVVAPGSVPGGSNYDGTTYYVQTRGPVTWAEVRRLNRAGLVAVSRAVLLNPPPADLVAYPAVGQDNAPYVVGLIVIGGMALIEVALLAGPAFAVGARRREHDLALLAAVGANRRQLRRMVLADGVVAGSLGGLIGAIGGIALAAIGLPLLATKMARDPGSFDVRPWELLALAAVGLVTAVLAAALPARTAARGDVVATLRGQRGQARASRALPICGAVAAALGMLVAGTGGTSDAGAYRILVGVALVEAGIIACTPVLLTAFARLAGHAPVPVRMALRDAARNRASAAAALAAVMAAVVGAVGIAVALTSTVAYDRQQSGDPFLPLDSGLVVASDVFAPGQAATVVARLRSTLPAATIRTLTTAAQCQNDRDSGCLAAIPRPSARLRLPQPFLGPLLIADAKTVALLTGGGSAAAVARTALVAGRPVVFAAGTASRRNVTVRLVLGPRSSGRTVRAEAAVVGTGYGLPPVVLPPSLARSLHLRAVPSGVYARVPGGVSAAVEQAADAALYDVDHQLSLEVPHPYRDRYAAARTAFIVGGGAIAVVAAVISTALARLERRRDLQTLAAVGAGPGMGRCMALTQGALIAGIGTVLGTAVGFVAPLAYIAATNRSRSGSPSDPKMPLAVPWPTLVLLIVLVTLVASGLSAVLGRHRSPAVAAPDSWA